MTNYAVSNTYTDTYTGKNFTQKLLTAPSSIVSALKKHNNYEIVTATADNISYQMDFICENNKRIDKLLKAKKSISMRIDALLDLYSFSKNGLTKAQMKAYKNYNNLLIKENSVVSEKLQKINDKKYLKNIANIIMENSDNFNELYYKLGDCIVVQNELIISLNKIISKANKVIKTL